LQVNVQETLAKMVDRALEKTSVVAHLFTLVLSARGRDWELKPAPNAQAILDVGDSQGSGMYWIQPPRETAPAETYCDMNFAGGA